MSSKGYNGKMAKIIMETQKICSILCLKNQNRGKKTFTKKKIEVEKKKKKRNDKQN